MRRRSPLLILLAAVSASPAWTQQQQLAPIRAQVITPDDVDVKSRAYTAAFEAWLKGDPALEQDLTKRPKEEMLKRIDADDRRTTDYLSKRSDFFSTLLKTYQSKIKSLNDSADADKVRVNVDAFRTAVEQQKTQLIRDSENIQKKINAISAGSKDVTQLQLRQALQGQWDALRDLRLNLDDQLQALVDMKQNDESLDQSRKKVLGGSQSIVTSLEKEVSDVELTKTRWTSYYGTLRAAVNNAPVASASTGPGPATSGPAQPASGSINPPPPPPPPPSRPFVAGGNLAGTWILTQPENSLPIRPESATLVIREEGGLFKGQFSSHFPASAKNPPSDLVLSFEARANKVTVGNVITFRFASGGDYDGKFEILGSATNDPDVIEVTWDLTAAPKDKLRSDDILLRRQR